MPWDEEIADLDETADSELGNTIEWSTDGGATFVEIAGFVSRAQEDESGMQWQGVDPLNGRSLVKVNKNLVDLTDIGDIRIQALALGAGVFDISNYVSAVDNRYWLLDVKLV